MSSMVDVTSDLLAEFDAVCRAEDARLTAEAEGLLRRLDEIAAERAQIAGSRRVFLLFLERMRDRGGPLNGRVASSTLGVETTREPVTSQGDGPPPPTASEDAVDPGPSDQLTEAPEEERSVAVAADRGPKLRERIADIMAVDRHRSWSTKELQALLYDNPNDCASRTKRETVRKTLERMVEFGLVTRHGTSYTPTENTGDAVGSADGEHVAGNDSDPTPTQITGEVLPIAN
jgi:hypothetical protein